MNKIILLALLTTFSIKVYSQSTDYSFCGCTESLTDEGKYSLECGDVLMEEGQFSNGERTGIWITRNSTGQTIIKANYVNDILSGAYEQYHFKGTPKLKANFKDGLPDGNWVYSSDKGKVIKQGSYEQGKPVGVWKIFDKKGKKVIIEYDFFTSKSTLASGKRYFEKGGIARDDVSGEWMILGFPQRNISAETKPLGGYLLAGDLFLDYLNIPFMYMNTYAHYEFIAEVKMSDGVLTSIEIKDRPKDDRFSSSEPSFPFLVTTNSPAKLSRIKHSDASRELVKGRIKDVIGLTGPWIGQNFTGTLKIQIPWVVNDIKR
ncbi:MAG: hypothetical protein ACJAQ2_001940 [Vicingaceae bacterium]|jgi:hypothetical protein